MKKILLIYNEIIPSVKLCASEPLIYAKNKGLIELRSKRNFKVKSLDINWCDIIIFVRADAEYECKIADIAKKIGRKIVYILDDDLFDVPGGQPYSEFYYKKETQSYIKYLIKASDLFLSPSKKLINKYGSLSNGCGIIEEPVLFCKKDKNITVNSKIKVGFSGGKEREKELNAIITPVIKYFLENYPENVQFEFMGARPECVDIFKLKHYPYESSYEKYQKVMDLANWDIGISPLFYTEFNSCKHYNKLIEYSGFGIAGIYSNVTPYKEMVINNKTGVLAENTSEEWIEKIEFLLNNSNVLLEIKENALNLAHTTFSIDNVSKLLLGEIDKLKLEKEKKKLIIYRLPLYKFMYIFKRLVNFVKKNKEKSLILLIKKIMKK